jgi:hypothetical protein
LLLRPREESRPSPSLFSSSVIVLLIRSTKMDVSWQKRACHGRIRLTPHRFGGLLVRGDNKQGPESLGEKNQTSSVDTGVDSGDWGSSSVHAHGFVQRLRNPMSCNKWLTGRGPNGFPPLSWTCAQKNQQHLRNSLILLVRKGLIAQLHLDKKLIMLAILANKRTIGSKTKIKGSCGAVNIKGKNF